MHRDTDEPTARRAAGRETGRTTRARATEADPRWAALLTRDPAADGRFLYSVATTGVFCRPSCGARRPRPEHVAFHATVAEARAQGFRPCQRCAPEQPSLAERRAGLVASLCRQIEAAPSPPSLAALAKCAGLSPQHLHRVFKAVTGLTPKAYADGERARRARAALGHRDGDGDGARKSRGEGRNTVTAAIYTAGFQSSGRFYEASQALLGMSPSAYRAGGAGTEIRFAVGECSLGSILVASSARGVCAILLGEDPEVLARELEDRFPRATLIGGDAGFQRLVARVVGCVEAPAFGLDLPLDLRGTTFQLRVWQALREIPAGTTASYSEIAARLGAPGAARAVAAACAANKLAVAIPCHRVVRRDGSLSGYRWGIERKRALLERERQGGQRGEQQGEHQRGHQGEDGHQDQGGA